MIFSSRLANRSQFAHRKTFSKRHHKKQFLLHVVCASPSCRTIKLSDGELRRLVCVCVCVAFLLRVSVCVYLDHGHDGLPHATFYIIMIKAGYVLYHDNGYGRGYVLYLCTRYGMHNGCQSTPCHFEYSALSFAMQNSAKSRSTCSLNLVWAQRTIDPHSGQSSRRLSMLSVSESCAT